MAQAPAPKTYWRCDACGNELLFKISRGTQVECLNCHKVWSVPELFANHKRAHPDSEAP